MTSLSYSKPKEEQLAGLPALQLLNKWLRPGRLRLRGGKDDLGFLFLYELMTGAVRLCVLPGARRSLSAEHHPIATKSAGYPCVCAAAQYHSRYGLDSSSLCR